MTTSTDPSPDPPNEFRILSLDGGGTWALIQVLALQNLYGEKAGGHEVLKHFDLAVANSGGSLVLGMLATNRGLHEALALVRDKQSRERIFDPILRAPIDRAVGIGPRYSAEKKLVALRSLYAPGGDTHLKDWRLENAAQREVRLVICGFDYDRLRELFFRSRPHELDADATFGVLGTQRAVVDATIVEAIHASSNAPVNYFDEPATFGDPDARFWDGAMGGYNNPVLGAVVEAGCDPTLDRSRIRVLSIGTGSVSLPEAGVADHGFLLNARATSCLLTDGRKAATCVLDDPPDAASFVAHVMLCGRLPALGKVVGDGPIVRMSPVVQPVRSADRARWVCPAGIDAEDFRSLMDLDMDAVGEKDVDLIVKLTTSWLGGHPQCVRNQPIRASRWLEVEIGHSTFAEARAAWAKYDTLL